MKKWFIVGGGIAIIVLLAFGGWAYLMMTGTTASSVSLDTTPAQQALTPDLTPQYEPVAITRETEIGKLRQLSTRQVAGAVLITGATDTIVRYTEAGTGHTYEVPLQGQSEIRLTNTTFARTTNAVWSREGSRVVISYEKEGVEESYLGAITKGDDGTYTITGSTLPRGSHSFGFSETSDLLYYAVTTTLGTEGFSRNLQTGKETALFTTPLREVTVSSWNPTPLIVTKASSELLGYAYDALENRITDPARALRGTRDAKGGAFSGLLRNSLTGWLTSTTTQPLDRGVFIDKCTLTREQLVCGIPKKYNGDQMPDEWYRGEVSYDDTIYTFNRATGISTLVANPLEETRREMDIARFEESDSEGQLLLTTKTDRILWLLRL